MKTPEMTVVELKEAVDRHEDLVLLDVREPLELEYSKIDGVLNIPMEQVPARKHELDPAKKTVVICRSGARSEEITEYLRTQRFGQVFNLVGGMNEWTRVIDPSQKIY